MITETVTIKLSEYNKLRDFLRNIKSNKIAIYNNYGDYYTYYSAKEIEAKIIEGLKIEKNKEIRILKKSNEELKKKLVDEKSKRRRWWN
tara:strand:- start:2460 stop:2726 length:267 start_codon:yes stop_codon:yes gene_type:complete